jgi:hypothetical protein
MGHNTDKAGWAFTGIFQGSRLISTQGQHRLTYVQANTRCLIIDPTSVVAAKPRRRFRLWPNFTGLGWLVVIRIAAIQLSRYKELPFL